MAKKEEEVKQKTKLPTAIKRDTQNLKRRTANREFKSQIRTAIRSFEEALEKKEEASIKENLSAVYGLVDKGVKRGIFKLNKAGRTKARLAAKAARNA